MKRPKMTQEDWIAKGKDDQKIIRAFRAVLTEPRDRRVLKEMEFAIRAINMVPIRNTSGT